MKKVIIVNMIYGCLGGLIVYILGDIQSLLFKTNILHGFRNHYYNIFMVNIPYSQ